MKFEELKVGGIYYIVKSSENGPTKKKVLVISKMPSIKAVLLIDENKNQTKLYQDSLKDLLTQTEAEQKYNEIKNLNPLNAKSNSSITNSGIWTTCWHCGTYINRNNSKKCQRCGWNKCPRCGSCQCNFNI